MTSFSDHLQAALGANYQLDRELTGGGMSRVFVAVDSNLGRKVVVKVLPPELAAGVNRDRFRREIQVAAQLQHPHVVPLLSAGEQGDLLWYTMPYIEGESLRAALERHKKFSVREVVRIMHDIVDALAFAHERGVIHRDIKPANILTQGAHALVTDFGVAKAISAALPITTATAAGIAIGTPAYMAPEQLAGDPNADHRLDLYAVGLLAYELLTGESPFTGPSPRETMAAQLTRDPKPLHEVSAEVPRTLSALIMRLLAKDPNDRPRSADEVLRELDSLTMPMGVTPQGGGIPARTQRKRWLPAAALLGVVIIGGVAYAMMRQPPARNAVKLPPPPPTRAATDSIVRSAAVASGVTQAAPAPKPVAKPVISHADSVAIAEAVRKRIEAAKARDSVAKAKLAEQTERRMMDSIIAANSGASAAVPAGPRRIVIAEPREVKTWPEVPLLGRAVADSLRRMLRQRKQYVPVDQDSVRQALARSRGTDEISGALNAELIASIQFNLMRGDSAMLVMQLYDLGAAPQYRTRAAVGRRGPKSEVLTNLDVLLLETLTHLDQMSRAPRKQAPNGTQ